MKKTTKTNTISSVLLSLFNLFALTAAIAEPELDDAIAALRSRGYNLFGNAITASNVRLNLLTNASFTLFAPTDSTLFSLDMACFAASYVASVSYHVALGRFSLPHLHSLPDRSSLPTLVPGREILISRREEADGEFVTADGVDVVIPGLFYGQDVAVHGLDGILSLHRKRVFAGAPVRAAKPAESLVRGPSSPIRPGSRLLPPMSPRSPFSPSTAPDSGPSASIPASTAPNSDPSPAISHSIQPGSPVSPSISPDLSPSPGFSPSFSPESGHLHFSGSTAGFSPATATATSFSWGGDYCKQEGAVDCSKSHVSSHGEKMPRQLAPGHAL